MKNININTHSLKFELDKLKENYSKEKARLELKIEQRNDKQEEMDSTAEFLEIQNKVNILLQKTSENQRKKACTQIEELCTLALQYVYGPSFKLWIDLKPSKKPEADIYVIIDGIVCRPQDSVGGGVVDVISTALKIVILVVFRPSLDGPIILDEPGKHVSINYAKPFINFLKFISEKFDRQIIMVTHNLAFAIEADRIFLVTKENTTSSAKVVSVGELISIWEDLMAEEDDVI